MPLLLKICPPLSARKLNALFARAWPDRRGDGNQPARKWTSTRAAEATRRGADFPVRHAQEPVRRRGLRPAKARCSKSALLRQALVYVCAYEGKRLIGFAKVIGDGGVHGFLLDPTVAPEHQRQGIGRRLVRRCALEARRHGVEWLHVDFEPHLANFYRACGFSSSTAGLLNLKNKIPAK